MKPTMKFTPQLSSIFAAFLLVGLFSGCGYFDPPPPPPPVKNFQVAAFYVPHTEADWGRLSATTSAFVGHMQPKQALWDHKLEWHVKSLRHAAIKSLAHLQGAGVDALVIHTYHFNDGPFRSGALDIYLDRLNSAHPLDVAIFWDNRDHSEKGSGVVNSDTFKAITARFVDQFKKRSYWKVGNRPFLAIADLENFVAGFDGDIEKAAGGLERLRNKTILSGFDNAYIVGYSNGLTADRADVLVDALGLDAISTYTWADDIALPDFPATAYEKAHEIYLKAIAEGGGTNLLTRPANRFKARYIPCVIMGYDPAPLTDPSIDWESQRGYPYGPYLNAHSPSKFTQVLKQAKEAASQTEEKIILINAWNDWRNGSYLEPEEMFETGFLDAVRHVFVDLEGLDIRAWIKYRTDVKYDRLNIKEED
ncbi:MAG: hypothetical protein ACI9TH_003405 [Kiritimatiellia bacterium]|jgi:hypothetical protein